MLVLYVRNCMCVLFVCMYHELLFVVCALFACALVCCVYVYVCVCSVRVLCMHVCCEGVRVRVKC